ncbi:MAG: hypothetical protein H6677_17300 [Candidatus Obscuribacterales bacterium]|nr:hypothetical protein [Candidatus Obscuribacterales bacterium]
MSRSRSVQVLIGDLLVNSGLITAGQMADAVPISLTTSLPVGRILVSSGYLSEADFKAAVSAQSLIRENLLHMDLAISALRLVKEHRIGLDEALNRLGWRSEYYETTNKLGDLLLEAGFCTREDLKAGLEDCYSSGMPLGRVLVLRGTVNEMQTYAALTAQVLLRERKITRSQAVEGLRMVALKNLTLEESLKLDGAEIHIRTQTIRLGELLMLAGLVSEIDLLSAVERGLLDEQPIGQILVRVGLITESTLEHALILQGMVAERRIKPLHAGLVLKKVRRTGTNLNQAIDEVLQSGGDDSDRLELPELLKSLGLIGNSELLKAIDLSSSGPTTFLQVVQAGGLVDKLTIQAALRCLSLHKEGRLSVEQVLFAMQNFLGSRKPIDEILAGLGWIPQSV